jgi:hypothetical protein
LRWSRSGGAQQKPVLREGSTFEHQRSAGRHNKRAAAGRPSCFFERADVKEPHQGGRQQRTRLRRSWCPRPRQNRRGNGRSGREVDDSDESSQRDSGSSQEDRSNGDPVGKAAAATDPTKAMKEGWAAGWVQPGRGLRRTWQGVLTAPVTGEARSGRRCWGVSASN